jgi:hypothetical protein
MRDVMDKIEHPPESLKVILRLKKKLDIALGALNHINSEKPECAGCRMALDKMPSSTITFETHYEGLAQEALEEIDTL